MLMSSGSNDICPLYNRGMEGEVAGLDPLGAVQVFLTDCNENKTNKTRGS